MALSVEDRNEIKLTIIDTLNGKLRIIDGKIEKVEAKADRANTRIFLLVGYLAGAGIITAGALVRLFSGGAAP